MDELAAVELDIWAQEQGLKKLRVNVLGLQGLVAPLLNRPSGRSDPLFRYRRRTIVTA